MKSRTAARRSEHPWLSMVLLLLAACSSGETTATEVLVVIESDLSITTADSLETGLTSLRVRTFDPAGLRMLDERFIPLTQSERPQPGTGGLPFSFSIVPTFPSSTSTFRLVVTGSGPDGTGATVELVERQVLFSFRPRVLQEVRVFLGQGCIANLCRAADGLTAQTCNPETRGCEELPMAGIPQGAAQPSDSAPDAAAPEAIPDALVPEAPEPGSNEPDGTGSTPPGDDGTAPMETIDVDEACAGSSGATVCAGSHLIQCDENGQVVGDETCASARHCQEALTTGACPVCLEGEHRCVEATLERCNAALEWETAETCATVDLCNAEAKACTDAVCVAGSKTCTGDTLQGCNASQTAFEALQTCMPGLCDPVASECDVCIPGVRACDGGDAVRSCSADGQVSNVESCGSARPKCTGDGVCVQCTHFSDCPTPSSECRLASCNVASGTCGSIVKAQHTKCSTGVCDGSTCVGCIRDSDCGGSTPQCRDGSCVQCTADSHCGGSAGECMAPSCDTRAGTCGFAPKPASTRCSGGVCDGSGTCVGCTSGADCSGSKPYCSGGGCVACTANSHCSSSAHEACKNNACVVQPYCGDGRVTSGEQCDPKAPNWSPFTCSEDCVKRDLYKACESNSACRGGTYCMLGMCTNSGCTSDSDCPAAPKGTGLRAACSGGDNGICGLRGCRSNSDCGDQLTCFISEGVGACTGCFESSDCDAGKTCDRTGPDGTRITPGLCK